jgi:two-component system chemotaxis response regulator CheB
VLSGALHDGASGLWTIKRLGGTAIIQDPNEAEFSSMPRSALEYVDADYIVGVQEIGPLLVRLANEQPLQEALVGNNPDTALEERIAKEVNIAAGNNLSEKTVLELGELTPFTCPECQGTLIRIKEGTLFRYRCHTGHGFTEEALLDGILEITEDKIWQVTRVLQEAELLLEHIGKHIRDAGEPVRAERFFARAREVGRRASRFQEAAVDRDELDTSN